MRTQSSFLRLSSKAGSEVGVVSVSLKDNGKISERGGLVTQVVVGIGSTICSDCNVGALQATHFADLL